MLTPLRFEVKPMKLC